MSENLYLDPLKSDFMETHIQILRRGLNHFKFIVHRNNELILTVIGVFNAPDELIFEPALDDQMHNMLLNCLLMSWKTKAQFDTF
jgi:hypothetical protein